MWFLVKENEIEFGQGCRNFDIFNFFWDRWDKLLSNRTASSISQLHTGEIADLEVKTNNTTSHLLIKSPRRSFQFSAASISA